MKISDIKIYTLDAFRTNWAFIKVETDEGLYGWGEASLGTNEMALEGMVQDLKRLIVGRDPLQIEKMLFEVYRDIYWKGGAVLMSAISGIEIALWDIAGKYFNTPTYNLLGGKMRDEVKMYANAWFVGARTPEEFAKKAKRTVDLGIKALKWDPFGAAHMTISKEQMEKTVNIVGAVREAVGNNVDLLIECHGRFGPTAAIEISRELEQFKPMFMEEPQVLFQTLQFCNSRQLCLTSAFTKLCSQTVHSAKRLQTKKLCSTTALSKFLISQVLVLMLTSMKSSLVLILQETCATTQAQ